MAPRTNPNWEKLDWESYSRLSGLGIEAAAAYLRWRGGLDLPFLATFNTDRNSGEGIEKALFDVLERARAAHLEAGGL